MAYFQFGLYDTLYSYSKINHNYFFPEKEQIRNKIALLYEKANISKKLPKKNMHPMSEAICKLYCSNKEEITVHEQNELFKSISELNNSLKNFEHQFFDEEIIRNILKETNYKDVGLLRLFDYDNERIVLSIRMLYDLSIQDPWYNTIYPLFENLVNSSNAKTESVDDNISVSKDSNSSETSPSNDCSGDDDEASPSNDCSDDNDEKQHETIENIANKTSAVSAEEERIILSYIRIPSKIIQMIYNDNKAHECLQRFIKVIKHQYSNKKKQKISRRLFKASRTDCCIDLYMSQDIEDIRSILETYFSKYLELELMYLRMALNRKTYSYLIELIIYFSHILKDDSLVETFKNTATSHSHNYSDTSSLCKIIYKQFYASTLGIYGLSRSKLTDYIKTSNENRFKIQIPFRETGEMMKISLEEFEKFVEDEENEFVRFLYLVFSPITDFYNNFATSKFEVNYLKTVNIFKMINQMLNDGILISSGSATGPYKLYKSQKEFLSDIQEKPHLSIMKELLPLVPLQKLYMASNILRTRYNNHYKISKNNFKSFWQKKAKSRGAKPKKGFFSLHLNELIVTQNVNNKNKRNNNLTIDTIWKSSNLSKNEKLLYIIWLAAYLECVDKNKIEDLPKLRYFLKEEKIKISKEEWSTYEKILMPEKESMLLKYEHMRDEIAEAFSFLDWDINKILDVIELCTKKHITIKENMLRNQNIQQRVDSSLNSRKFTSRN